MKMDLPFKGSLRQLLGAALLILMPACDRGDAGTVVLAAPLPAQPTGRGEDIKATPSAVQGCHELLLDQTTPSGRVQVALCGCGSSAELRFVHQFAGKMEVRAYPLNAQVADAIVHSEAKLWSEHLVSVDLAQERGGWLVLGDFRDGMPVISSVPYVTADEESLVQDFRDGALYISTQFKGERRLTQVEVGEDRGKFHPERVSCEWGPPAGIRHHFDLSLGTDGRVIGVGYVGFTPQQNGAVTSCSIDADRDDPETRWSSDASETRIELLAAGVDHAPDGEAESDDSRIRIRSESGRYTVTFEMNVSDFCGHSSVHARSITLDPRNQVCESVESPDG
jgi:hypothetical protein